MTFLGAAAIASAQQEVAIQSPVENQDFPNGNVDLFLQNLIGTLAPEGVGEQNLDTQVNFAVTLDLGLWGVTAFHQNTLCNVGVGSHTLSVTLNNNDGTSASAATVRHFSVSGTGPNVCFGWRIWSAELGSAGNYHYANGACGPGQGVINTHCTHEGPGQGVIGSDLQLNIWATGFNLTSPAGADPNASGQGHYRIYLDNTSIGIGYKNVTNITGLSPGETHCITVVPENNNNTTFGAGATICVFVLDHSDELQNQIDALNQTVANLQADVQALNGRASLLLVLAAVATVVAVIAVILVLRKGGTP